MSDIIGVCQTCGCEVRQAEGFSFGGGRFVAHYNDHLCLLAIIDAHRQLQAEKAQVEEQLQAANENLKLFVRNTA